MVYSKVMRSAGNAKHGTYVTNKNGEKEWVIQPDAKAGDLKFVDYNGDGKITVMRTVSIWVVRLLKRLLPLHLGITWKKLSFSAMFQGVGGAQALYVGNTCF